MNTYIFDENGWYTEEGKKAITDIRRAITQLLDRYPNWNLSDVHSAIQTAVTTEIRHRRLQQASFFSRNHKDPG